MQTLDFFQSQGWQLYVASLPEALLLTIKMTVWGTILSTILGAALAFGGRSRITILRILSRGATHVVRAIPQPPMLLLVYFLIAAVFGSPTPDSATILTLWILFAPWVAELLRSGFQAVPNGLSEAGLALGMSAFTVQRRIVIPLAIRIMFPTYGQMVMSLMLSTAIASQIGARDVTGLARPLINSFFATELWVVVAAIYFCIAFPVSRVLNWMERRMKVLS